MQLLHGDWLNQNAYRRYPLIDGAAADVPNGLLVDMLLPVPMDLLVPDELFLRSVIGFGQGVVISFGRISAPSTTLAACTVFLADHQLNTSYALVGQGLIAGSVGRLVIGTLEALELACQTTRDFSSDPTSARLVPGAVRPALRGITGVSVVGPAGLSSFSGTITFVAGNNVSLVADEESNTLTINSSLTIREDEQVEDCGCGKELEPDRPCIRSINGVYPDSNGNLTLVGLGNLLVETSAGSIGLDDQTTTPCCECDQVDVLYQALQAVELESSQLLAISEQLRTRLDTLNSVVATSALNPPPSGG